MTHPAESSWRDKIGPETTALEGRLVSLRRDLHVHPELAFEEHRTAALAAKRLDELGYAVRRGVGRTGVVGLLSGAAPGPVVLHRADMDALPLQEEPGREHGSGVPGVMHACGHDAHVAIGLGLAERLSISRADWSGTVKLCFQPAEEGDGGARAMIADGLLDDPPVDVAFALHVDADLPVGTASVPASVAFAGCRDFQVRVEGAGGHGAMPHETRDPLACAAALVTELQSVVARRIDPLQSAVLTVGTFHAGTKSSIIPEVAELSGTLRAHDGAVLDRLCEELDRVTSGVASAHGCRSHVTFDRTYAPVVNDPRWVALVRACASSLLGEEQVSARLLNGSEDMSDVFARVPGCYYLVGARDEARGIVHPHHSPRFDIDEGCLLVGTELAYRVVRAALARPAR